MFYFTKDTFSDVLISMWNRPKSVAIHIKNIHQVIGILDEEFDGIKSISSMEPGEKPPRRLFRHRWEQPELQDFAHFGIDGAVQPVVVAVDADHFLLNRELIRTHRRYGL